LLSTSPLPAPPHHPPAHIRIRIRPQDAALSASLVAFAEANVGNTVTFDKITNKILIWDHNGKPPDKSDPEFPACANFVWAALEKIGAKTTADFNVVDPPGLPPDKPSMTDYKWGDPVLTFHPKVSPISDLSAVQPGDVLQFRNPTPGIVQHSAIVLANLGNGRLLVAQQNFNLQTWVTADPTLDVHDFNTFTNKDGTVWVYRPVASPAGPVV
jgi:hypothetical protein